MMVDSKKEEAEGTTDASLGSVEAIDVRKMFSEHLESMYVEAESVHGSGNYAALESELGAELYKACCKLGETRHAARGIALTLLTYKLVNPSQDIRRHKAEFDGGFAARSIDNACTVPFLERRSLPYNVETHWLSQTFSFAGPLERGMKLTTNPPQAGPLVVDVVNAAEERKLPAFTRAAAVIILTKLIDARNKGKVALTRPKNLGIEQVVNLLEMHFSTKYKTNAPRLPQIAMYALYVCLVKTVARYNGCELQPLERLKAANRKSGSVGDIDVNLDGRPFEAVEIKFDVLITSQHIAEAIQKIKTATVQRYLVLSTAQIARDEGPAIELLREKFRKSNGCEIIVNGVYDTIKYYLRLLKSTNDFLNSYVELLEVDKDIDYEHRLSWNDVCTRITS